MIRLAVFTAIVAAFLFAFLATAPAQQGRVLPPIFYDHPYAGKLVMTRARDADMVRQLCNRPIMYPAIGCSFPTKDLSGCWIIMAPDKDIRAAGWDPDIVRRHEIGHCNGWPANHLGARTIEKPREAGTVEISVRGNQ